MNKEGRQGSRFRIDDLIIDAGTHEVRQGDRVLDLPQLSFQLLLALAESAPNFLTHDQLIERVWPGRIVSPETVTQRVKLLRQALGDDAHAPRYIGLVRGEGYRMLAEVQALSDADGPLVKTSPPLARQRIFRVGLLIGVLASVLIFALQHYARRPLMQPDQPDFSSIARSSNSVAVLPFFNASQDPSDRYISEGLGNELRDQLGRHPGLRVAARTSSVAFRGQSLDAVEISDRLGVAMLIEGTLRREASHWSISVQVIDGASGFQTWSRSYTARKQNLLDVQQQISREVAQQLLPQADGESFKVNPVTHDVSAYEIMLLARHYEQQVRDKPTVDQELLQKVIDLYREATVSDPQSALAHSRLGGALLYQGDVEGAESPILKALQLDPDLADVQYTLGLYYWMRHLPGSGAAYERAIQLNENHADALGAYGTWRLIQMDAAVAEEYLTRALRLDPMSQVRYLELGNYFGLTGRMDKARALAQEIESRFNDAQAFEIIARIYELTGELDIALAWAFRVKEREPNDPESDWLIAELYARLGDFDLAAEYEPEPGIGQLYWQRRYEELIELGEELLFEYPGDMGIWYALAWAYNATGRFEQTIDLLTRAGLPGNALADTRRPPAFEAMVTLTDAYDATEQTTKANDLATRIVDHLKTFDATSINHPWWPNIYMACAHAILGEDDRAMELLIRVAETAGMVWYPLVWDSYCFQRFAGDPRYEAVAKALDDRLEALRRKLPETLAAMGVEPLPPGRSE